MKSKQFWFMWFLALAVAAMLGDFQGQEADAGTMAGGTAIALGGLDSFAKTIDKYAKGNLGKMVGMIIAMAGIAGMAFQKIGMGLTALGAGIAIAFVPNIIGTAFDTTAASPMNAAAPFVPWAGRRRHPEHPGTGRLRGAVASGGPGQGGAGPGDVARPEPGHAGASGSASRPPARPGAVHETGRLTGPLPAE